MGMKQHKVHVIKERVGGGFGSKQDILLEEVCSGNLRDRASGTVPLHP
ncbi:hypothetical protein DMI69_03880 [Escherichia coli]|nr:hypothetical protein [Escherichia coli]